jgi:hypothetical protein
MTARDAEAKKSAGEAAEKEGAAKKAETDARERESEAVARADEANAAKSELEVALADLHSQVWSAPENEDLLLTQILQEEAYSQRTTALKKASEEGTVMTMSKAKMELAQHLDTDPLPLRKAKITQEAALKKADKATVIAQEAADLVSSARVEAQRTLSQVGPHVTNV